MKVAGVWRYGYRAVDHYGQVIAVLVSIKRDAKAAHRLRRLRVEQAQLKLRLGPGYQDDGYVFAQFDGRTYHPERFSTEFDRKQLYFNRDHPDEALPSITLHGLRHTWATLALSAGIDNRHQDRQRAPEPQQHQHHPRDLHPCDPPMQSDAAERVAGLILRK